MLSLSKLLLAMFASSYASGKASTYNYEEVVAFPEVSAVHGEQQDWNMGGDTPKQFHVAIGAGPQDWPTALRFKKYIFNYIVTIK